VNGGDGFGRQLRPFAFADQQLRAPGVEFRRAALVGLDMGMAVADDRAERRAQRRQGERIGRRPGRHPQGGDIGLEQLREGLVEPGAPAIAVIGGVEAVGLGERGHRLRAGGRGIVGEKAHARPLIGGRARSM
jgi:hypothetical protein